jgi:hypothetical protein
MSWFSRDRRDRIKVIIKSSVAFMLLALVLWFPLTWFFFGSVHPCGILEWRMREGSRAYARLYARMETADKPENRERAFASNLNRLKREVYELTPASCLWHNIVWKWDYGKDKDIKRLEDDVELIERVSHEQKLLEELLRR